MRYALTYGLLTGTVIILSMLAGLMFGGHGSVFGTVWFGYLIMLVALTFLFVGVKRYRDVECGGVVKFLPALAVGLGIAMVAALAYVAIWEVYLAMTHYAFMDDYIASIARQKQAAGLSGAALAREMAPFESMRAMYRNPMIRMAMTSIEILPVAILVAFLSAFALRFPKVLPAR